MKNSNVDLWFVTTEGGIMTSTLKTETRAILNTRGLVPTGALKSVSVEGSEKIYEKACGLAFVSNGDIGKACRLT